MIAKFRYHSENCRHSENLNFAMHSDFRYDSEFSLGLRNFRYHCEIFAILAKISLCHSEIPDPLASCTNAFLSFQLDISSSRLDMMAEVHKTCKIIKNNHETKSVVLIGHAPVNRLN